MATGVVAVLLGLVPAACAGPGPEGAPAASSRTSTPPDPAPTSATPTDPAPGAGDDEGGTTGDTGPDQDPESSPAPDAIARVAWADDLEGGRSLRVFPTEHGRSATPEVIDQGWAEVVALVPEVDTVTMARQFHCHALGAPDKPSWNLEPWRPEVPFVDVLLARCNPV